MPTTSDVKVTAGAGTNVATYDITEDAETKKLQRVVLSDNSGADIGPAKEAGGNLATLAGIVSGAKGAVKAASGDFADGSLATLGAKADARDTHTDTTAITAMQVLKQISYMLQNPAALAAGTNLLGQISASNETSTIYNGTTALTPSFATISTSSSGATSLVSAVASHKIRVVSLYIVANGAVNVKFQSHTTPTDLTGLAYLVANTGFVLPYNPTGWFQTVLGEQLDINLSAAVAVGGALTYVAV